MRGVLWRVKQLNHDIANFRFQKEKSVKSTIFLLVASTFLAAASLAQTPHIISVAPSQNALDVSESTVISVAFDIGMNAETINESSFKVNASSTGPHQGSIVYENNTFMATLDPLDDFDVGEAVSVTLTTAIESADGRPLENSYSWSFIVTVSDESSGIFGQYSEYAVDEWPKSIYPADFDGDGDIDVAVTCMRTGDVKILLNNGEGVFAVDSAYWIGWSPLSVVGCDLDGDNDIDLAATLEDGEYFGYLVILINQGNGTFHFDGTRYNTDGGGSSMLTADLDGDGDLELATVNSMFATTTILFNNGQAEFGSRVDYSVGGWPVSITTSDLENDGDPDLIIANEATNDVSILYNNGDGTFAPQYRYPVGSMPTWIVSVDLNGDGLNDLAAAIADRNISVLLNEGDGNSFSETYYNTGSEANVIFPADLNGDGWLDLAGTGANIDSLCVMSNDGTGAYSDFTGYSVGDFPLLVAAADFNGDDMLDLAVANLVSNDVSILLNDARVGVPFAGEKLPVDLRLDQNYPNPFNSSTEIWIELPQPGRISLAIYDITGRQVKTLLHEVFDSGVHKVIWDGTDNRDESAVSGIYFYTLENDTGKISRRMILLR